MIKLWSKEFPINNMEEVDQEYLRLYLYLMTPEIKSTDQFKSEDLRKTADTKFGKDYKYQDGVIYWGKDYPLYEYDSENKMYERKNDGNFGELAMFIAKKYFQNATKENDTITINYKLLYTQYCGICGGSYTIYKNANGAMNLDTENALYNKDKQSTPINEEDEDNIYNEHKDEISTTSFIFKKDSDGTYHLRQIKAN